MSDILSLAVALKSKFGVDETKEEIEERLVLLKKQLERLKVLYEQYFMGIQKIAPAQLHRDVERGVRELRQMHIGNTAMRYRYTAISSRYGSYNAYWRRTMRLIESGKYFRDVNRAVRRAREKGEIVPDELLQTLPKRVRERIERDREALLKRQEREESVGGGEESGVGGGEESGVGSGEAVADDEPAMIRNPKPSAWQIDDDAADLLSDDFDMDAMFAAITSEQEQTPAAKPPAPKVAARKPAAKPTPPRPRPVAKKPIAAKPAKPAVKVPDGSTSGMSEKQRRELYKRYIQARKLVGERIDNVSYERLMKTIDKQSARIMKRHKKAKRVDFNVVIKDDKVVLKAKPKG